MQCPVCEKTFAAELSICPSCGRMPTAHSRAEATLRFQSIEKITTADLEILSAEIDEESPTEIVETVAAQTHFAPENALRQPKREFHSTLIEFPKSRQQAVPSWRDEIKKRVSEARTRKSEVEISDAQINFNQPQIEKTSPKLVVQTVETVKPESATVIHLTAKASEQRTTQWYKERALERIQRSRQSFEPEPIGENRLAQSNQILQKGRTVVIENDLPIAKTTVTAQNRMFSAVETSAPPSVAPRRVLPMIEDEAALDELESPASNGDFYHDDETELTEQIEAAPTKVLVTTDDLDDDETIAASLNSVRKVSGVTPNTDALEAQQLSPRAATATVQRKAQTSGDYAPLNERIAAGAIDLAICASVGAVLLWVLKIWQPLNFSFVNFVPPFIAFVGLAFIYLTAAVHLSGTTVGLHLFKLQIVNADDAEIPALPQAAINAAVYLLSLALGGIGLLAAFFNTERRAAHNIIAGTIAVKD